MRRGRGKRGTRDDLVGHNGEETTGRDRRRALRGGKSATKTRFLIYGKQTNYETRLAAREAFQQMIAVGNRRSGASLLNLDACIVNRESRNV